MQIKARLVIWIKIYIYIWTVIKYFVFEEVAHWYLPPSNLLTWKVQSMGTTRKQVNIVDNKYVILTEISIHHKGYDCTLGDRKFVKEIRKDYNY